MESVRGPPFYQKCISQIKGGKTLTLPFFNVKISEGIDK